MCRMTPQIKHRLLNLGVRVQQKIKYKLLFVVDIGALNGELSQIGQTFPFC